MVSSQATAASPSKSPGHPIPVSVNISLFFVRSLISPSQGSRSQAVLNESTLKLESRKSSAPGATACSLRILLTSLHFTNSQGGSADLALLNQKGQLECPRYQKRRQDIKLRSPASVGFPIATHPIQRWSDEAIMSGREYETISGILWIWVRDHLHKASVWFCAHWSIHLFFKDQTVSSNLFLVSNKFAQCLCVLCWCKLSLLDSQIISFNQKLLYSEYK